MYQDAQDVLVNTILSRKLLNLNMYKINVLKEYSENGYKPNGELIKNKVYEIMKITKDDLNNLLLPINTQIDVDNVEIANRFRELDVQKVSEVDYTRKLELLNRFAELYKEQIERLVMTTIIDINRTIEDYELVLQSEVDRNDN